MNTVDEHADWVAHPVGKIPKNTYCSSCGRYNARTLACNAVLVNDAREALLVLRGEEPDKEWWDVPGGYLDWDETLEECTVRELYEETNLVVDIKDLQQYFIYSNPKNKAQNQVVDVYYIAKNFTGEISVDGEEILEAKWFPLTQLPEKVAFDHLLALNAVKKHY